jgi:LPXTG-motif cell wall-anchored protein
MKYFFPMFLIVTGLFLIIVFVPRMIDISSNLPFFYSILGFLLAGFVFFFLFKWRKIRK